MFKMGSDTEDRTHTTIELKPKRNNPSISYMSCFFDETFPEVNCGPPPDPRVIMTLTKGEIVNLFVLHVMIRKLFYHQYVSNPLTKKFSKEEWTKYVAFGKNVVSQYFECPKSIKEEFFESYIEYINRFLSLEVEIIQELVEEGPTRVRKHRKEGSHNSFMAHIASMEGDNLKEVGNISEVLRKIELFIKTNYKIDCSKIRQMPVDKYGKKAGTNLSMIYAAIKKEFTGKKLYKNAYPLACKIWGWDPPLIRPKLAEMLEINELLYDETIEKLPHRTSNLSAEVRVYYCMVILGMDVSKDDFKLVSTKSVINEHQRVLDSLSEKKGWQKVKLT